MTDQTFEDKVQKIAAEMRDAMRREDDGYPYAEFLSDMGDYIKDLEKICARARPLPTLADMTPAERRACRRMQCDVEGRGMRYVIANPHVKDGEVTLLDSDGGVDWVFPEYVTPRPDLPRMTWPNLPEANDTELPLPTKTWVLDAEGSPVVWTAPGDRVMIQRIEPGDLTPDQARTFALNVLAAAAYSEGTTHD